MSKKDVIRKDDIVQAVIVADTFEDEFTPLTNDLPLCLFPLLNKPILDYTLGFLSLGGVEETFLFCCTHVETIKEHIRLSIEQSASWSLNMKVHILVSESCRSFGDCLRDLDAKGLLRNEFILLEPGVISNVKLLPILKKHREIAKKDKGAAITVVFQEAGTKNKTWDDDVVIATNNKNRVVFHRNIKNSKEKKIDFPLELFLENNEVSVFHNLKNTHISICSSSVLPLFSDNFDFQTRDDFVKGLLMNEEIMGSTVYLHTIKGTEYGDAVTNWRKYYEISWEIKDRWTYPLIPQPNRNSTLKNNVIIGKNNSLTENVEMSQSILGDNIKLGKKVVLKNSFILSGTKIEDNVTIISSFIGPNCTIKNGAKISNSIVGKNVIVDKNVETVNKLLQSTKPEFCEKEDVLGKHCFIVNLDNDDIEGKYSTFFSSNETKIEENSTDDEQGFSDSEEEELSYTQSPVPDDTKLFFTEVIDSLTRGFEDELQCDNLILEINSSRYAYNISVKEVNFNVIRAILHMYLRQPTGLRYFSQLLSYFSPILKNYIRNESAMLDCLQAIEDVAIANEDVKENWVLFALKWFYNEDHLSEEEILKWGKNLDTNSKLLNQIKPFLAWLEEAEEASTSEEE